MTVRLPKYRLHKASGQALVQIQGRRIYLGKYDSPESRERYRQLIVQYLSGALPDKDLPSASLSQQHALTLDELILSYFKHALGYYTKDGKPTDEIASIRTALRRLRMLYGTIPAEEFGPKAFKLVRHEMIHAGLSRKYINDSMARIRRMFRWAVSEELLPPGIYQRLACVSSLRRGRSAARDADPVRPVLNEHFIGALPYMPHVVAAMAQVQRLTGCRPQEICLLRPDDIDRTRDVWEYTPSRHKCEHRGRGRVIFIGPRAQEILAPYLNRSSCLYCFSPRESEQLRRAASRLTPNSATPLSCTQRGRPRDHYDRHSYRRAIQRACAKAQVQIWSPNQLRHAAATEMRRQFGLEAAQTILGHAQADVTQLYAERDFELARMVMRSVG